MKKLFFLFLFIFLLEAETVLAFSISPLKHILSLDPGENQIVLVTIKNSDSFNHQYKLAVEGVVQDEKGRSILIKGKDKAESWVNFLEQEITIDALSFYSAEFKISVPKNASPGAHFLGLIAEEKKNAAKEIGVGKRLAVILQLQVAGLVTESAEILKWEINNWQFNKNLKLNLAVKNNSNIEVPLQGQFILRNFFGEEIYRDVVSVGGKVLPQTTREAGQNFFVTNLEKPGIYNAEVSLRYGLTNQILKRNTRFWYFPIWSWWVAGGLALIIIFLLIKLKNRLWLKSIGE